MLGTNLATAHAQTNTPTTQRQEIYRPQFHFTPAMNWMNDPNGLVYFKGQYHLFFQYNPSGPTWGNISWGHAVSKDLVYWRQLPVAIRADKNLIFSGGAVVDKHNTSGFGTKGNPPLVAIYTSTNKATGIQAQALAYSTDDGMTFTKYAGNPVIDRNSNNFRDPKVFWYAPAHEWRMVVALSAQHKISIYGSPDLKHWTHLSNFGPAGATGGVWEVPDLFPLTVNGSKRTKWVLVVNINPGSIAGGSGTQYFIGNFNGKKFVSDAPVSYTPPDGTVLQKFEQPGYGSWQTTGAAFGNGPAAGALPGQMNVTGYNGKKLANSFYQGDATTGTLTSPYFTINSKYLNFLIGGGKHPHAAGTTLDATPPPGPVFADFGGKTYGQGWTATGDFAGGSPVPAPSGGQQLVSGHLGDQRLDTFFGDDQATGTITSPVFTVDSNYIDLLVGGGHHPQGSDAHPTVVNLLVNGKVAFTSTGQDSGSLNWVAWNVADLKGEQAQIQVVDQNMGTGGWGHILLGGIVFSSEAAQPISTETAVNLLVDGQVVRTATGSNSETLDWHNWDVQKLMGQSARVQIVDNNTSGWGHINADQFTAADSPAQTAKQRAHWLDYGKDFYAAVTYNNVPSGRRIMIGWMNNWQYAESIPTSPWRSAMGVPRELSLRSVHGNLRVVQKPIQQLRKLYGQVIFSLPQMGVNNKMQLLPADLPRSKALDINLTLEPETATRSGLTVRTGNGEQTRIGYNAASGTLYVDRTNSGVTDFSADFPSIEQAPVHLDHGKLRLHILVDWSSVEVFAQDGARVVTDRIFPQSSSTGLGLFAEGGRAHVSSFKVRHMRSIWR